MSIFVIFRVADPAKVEAALEAHFPAKHMKVREGQYLVSGTGTAQAISDKLGLSEGELGSGIIFKMSNYFGRASAEIWDWIKTEAEASSG